MEQHHVFGAHTLVGDDDLELIAVLMWYEQIELNRRFVLHVHPPADKQKTVALAPARGLPLALEEAQLGVDAPPAPASLNHTFERGETLKRYRGGKLHAGAV